MLNKSLEKLSSGYKVNRAGDDSAGLAISEKMRGQIRGLNMASKNIQDGISLIQTAEGALNEIHSLLQRGRELSVQASNDTNVNDDRKAIQMEIDEIKKEITNIGNNTEFNTKKLLDGSLSSKGSSNMSQSTLNAVGMSGSAATVEDGWISFGYDSSLPYKVKLNQGEKVEDDSSKGLFTSLLISVNYGTGGIPQSLNIHATPNGEIITLNDSNLIYSYNGITIDATATTTGSGTRYIGGVFLTAGVNDKPTNDNSKSESLILQVGANEGQTVELTIDDVRSQALGIGGVSVLDNSLAQNAITSFDNAINTVSSVRSHLGAFQNRLEHTYNSVINTAENLTNAESRIRDADMAKEMMNFTKKSILMQATQSMLSQANQQSQSVLQLLN